jgi:protein involved in polysaccharide export with SLBB domain
VFVNRPAIARSLLLLLALACPMAAHSAAAPLRQDFVMQGDSTRFDWSRAPEYRIVPGDVLNLNTGPAENFPGDVQRRQTVRPDGRISVFPIGDVVAAGRTPSELETALVELLSAEFKAPRIVVEVVEFAGNQVHVLGRVRASGSYPAAPYMTVVQAITAAGGFEDDAARNSVIIFHRDGARTVRVSRLRLQDGIKSGHLEIDVPLSRFDIVYVPRSTIGNINVFTRQFFTDNLGALQFVMTGWELFNLEKVYPGRVINSGQVANP